MAASPLLLLPYISLWSAACALAWALPTALGDWHLVLDTAHTLLFVYLERFTDFLGVGERQLLHASYHAIFASALYYVLGTKAMTQTLAGRAYLPGAWVVVLSGSLSNKSQLTFHCLAFSYFLRVSLPTTQCKPRTS